MREWFVARRLVVATMHEKERVLAPVLERALGVSVEVPEGFDTDAFGTFTRDVPRAGTQLAAARAKARAALAHTGADVAVASEGSFGVHPQFPLVHRHLELVLLIDTRHQLEVAGWHETPGTLYAGAFVSSVSDGLELARSWGFPEQGVVVRAHKDRASAITKEASTDEELASALEQRLRWPWQRRCYLETDLRAHRAPARLDRIAAAAHNLVATLSIPCPVCTKPGFAAVAAVPGARCRACGLTTTNPAAHVRRCSACAHEATVAVPDGADTVDAGQCDRCNP